MLGRLRCFSHKINNELITLRVSVLPPVEDFFFGVGAGGYSNLK